MKNLIVLAIELAVLVHPSHQLSRYEALSKSGVTISDGNEWAAPSISSEYSWKINQYAQDGLEENDKIISLAGQPEGITFAQYAGYVTVDEQAGRALFYYFTEATEDPSTKPLLLWFNGGPGCSSFGVGAMTELGPFRVQPDGQTLSINPYAWNQAANTPFLESPAGVGFSYSNTSSDYLNGNDDNTAPDAYTFLLNWFERFPQYKNRDFYIAGESYAGFYVPELADTFLKNNNSRTSFINLKGVMIGNGIMNADTDHCGSINYAWSHALISDEDYADQHCTSSGSRHTTLNNTFLSKAESTDGEINDTPKNGLDGFDPCSHGYVFTYKSTPEVQSALHANVTDLSHPWTECRSETTMFLIYRRMMAAGLRILVYSGDVDAIVPVTATRYSINALELPIEEEWYPWMNGDLDVGGFSVIYKGLTFATVRVFGHEVPSYKPSRALTMIQFFLAGKPLPS